MSTRPPRPERKPILDALPWSADFGPHICARCYGAGWMVDRSGDGGGQLVACTSCDKIAGRLIARCWRVGSMNIADPNPPTLPGFTAYTPEAGDVIAAGAAFLRERFGWLTLHGGTGTGKSHAVEAIARYLLATNVPTVYITSTALWEYLGGVPRGEHDDVDYAERFRWFCELPGLAIDELNLEKSTDFVFKTRRNLLNQRYRAGMQGQSVTVLASNDAPDRWQDSAVADRALDSRFMSVFTGTKSYRQVIREREMNG